MVSLPSKLVVASLGPLTNLLYVGEMTLSVLSVANASVKQKCAQPWALRLQWVKPWGMHLLFTFVFDNESAYSALNLTCVFFFVFKKIILLLHLYVKLSSCIYLNVKLSRLRGYCTLMMLYFLIGLCLHIYLLFYIYSKIVYKWS